jgi:branched-subunit amino acid ABC-type transport system permease component
MLVVTALISDHEKAAHAAQKLRERGVEPDAIRTITHDPAAARAVATRSAGERVAALVTGALAGLLAGAMAGWVLGSQFDPLSPPSNWGVLGQQLTATVGAGLGLALGTIVGWLIGLLGRRRHIADYVRAVEDGDLLLVVTLEEAQLRPTEALLQSYGARDLHVGPSTAAPAAPLS